MKRPMHTCYLVLICTAAGLGLQLLLSVVLCVAAPLLAPISLNSAFRDRDSDHVWLGHAPMPGIDVVFVWHQPFDDFYSAVSSPPELDTKSIPHWMSHLTRADSDMVMASRGCAIGLPFRSSKWTEYRVAGERSWRAESGRLWIETGQTLHELIPRGSVVATSLIARGFLANVLLYTTCAYVLVLAKRAHQRRMDRSKRSRGQCVGCGYCNAVASAVKCSECGAELDHASLAA